MSPTATLLSEEKQEGLELQSVPNRFDGLGEAGDWADSELSTGQVGTEEDESGGTF